MLFNSLSFLLFLIIVLIVYPRLKHRAQNLFLLLASYYFYGSWDWRFTSLLMVSTVVDFYVGKKLHGETGGTRRRRFLFLSVAAEWGRLNIEPFARPEAPVAPEKN